MSPEREHVRLGRIHNRDDALARLRHEPIVSIQEGDVGRRRCPQARVARGRQAAVLTVDDRDAFISLSATRENVA